MSAVPMTEDGIKEEGTRLSQIANSIIIGNHEQYKDAAAMVKKCIKYKKFAYDIFEEEKKQAHLLHKAIGLKQKKFGEPFLKAENILRVKLGEFIRVEKEKAAKEAERLKGQSDHPGVSVVVDPIPEKEGIVLMEQWTYEVINQEIIPEEYKMVDAKKLGAVVRALKDQFRCPGIRVYKKATTQVRS